jgi:hypothetical protein
MMKKSLLAITALVASMAMSALPASADTIYTLTDSNTALTGPFGTVDVNLTEAVGSCIGATANTCAIITFTAESGYLFIDSSIADIQVNATSWTVGDFSFTCATTGCDGGSGQVNGFGTFNQTTNAFDGFASGVSSLNFELHNTSGTWATSADVLTTNGNGGTVAAHLAQISSGGTCTFFASNGTESPGSTQGSGCGTSVPEPASLMLLGAGLAGIGIWSWRRKSVQI